MKRVLGSFLAVVALAFIASPPPAAASNPDDVISNMHVTVTINPDSSLSISEEITYVIAGTGHGIWRAIPMLDNLSDNQQVHYGISINSVLQDGAAARYENSEDGTFVVVRIGDPNVLLSDSHTYLVSYSVRGALSQLPKLEATGAAYQLLWDVIGDQWDVPINNAEIEILLPGDPVTSGCVFGPPHSVTPCESHSQVRKLGYSISHLDAYEGATVQVQLPPSALTHFDTQDIRPAEDFFRDFSKGLPLGGAVGSALMLGVIGLAIRRRRSLATVRIQDFVRFEIPRNLRPAEIAAAWHGQVDARAFTATMLELATRGVVRLEIKSKSNIQLQIADATKPLAPWEQQLLTAVFAGDNIATLNGYRPKLAQGVAEVSKSLVSETVASGIRNPRQRSARLPVIAFTVIAAAASIASLIAFSNPTLKAMVFIPLLLTTLAAAISIAIVPLQQTEESAAFLGEVMGFRKALDTEAAADRREYVNRTGLDSVGVFATMLPYAVLFGLEKSWSAQFPQLLPEQLQPYGVGVVAMSSMSHGIDQTLAAFTASLSAPSSDSSGGASSGGGGGGGGGW